MQWNSRCSRRSFNRWLRDIVDESNPVEGGFFHGRAPTRTRWFLWRTGVGAIKNPKTSAVTFTQEEKDILLGKAAETGVGICRR